jgi:hypothetical protein
MQAVHHVPQNLRKISWYFIFRHSSLGFFFYNILGFVYCGETSRKLRDMLACSVNHTVDMVRSFEKESEGSLRHLLKGRFLNILYQYVGAVY